MKKNQKTRMPKGRPHLLRSWEPDCAAEGEWLRGVGEGELVAFAELAEGGGTLEDGLRT